MSEHGLMIGPDQHGQGGISRVVALWKRGFFLRDHSFKYIPTVDDSGSHKTIVLLKALIAFLRQLPSKRLVYVHTASFNSFYRKSIFLFISALFQKKIILHIHPSYFYHFLMAHTGVKKRMILFLLSFVDTFVVLTHEMQEKIRSIFPDRPVYVLGNPVCVDDMGNPGNIKRDRNRFLFLGWFVRGKGVYDLVDAAKILVSEGYEFVIHFHGTKKTDQLREYVGRNNLEPFIQVHGWADEREKIMALYRSAAMVLPSHTEGIPNVILEAMATKTPIVSTRVGGLVEILRDGENAIITAAKNPADIADKLKIVLNDGSYCKTVAENAYVEVRRKYDLPVIKRRFEEIIRTAGIS